MAEEQDILFSKARAVVDRLLKFRVRSEHEIIAKLNDKGFDSAIIEKVVSFLKERKIIDDEAFAKVWIVSRLLKPMGLRRIRQELTEKGVAGEIIDTQLARLTKDYDEAQAAEESARKRIRIYQNLDLITQQKRLEGYLLRRGFSAQVVCKTIEILY